jgi:hypothetical protein
MNHRDSESTETVVEIKSGEHLLPIHEARLRSSLRHSRAKRGWMLKFHFSVLNHGIGERASK